MLNWCFRCTHGSNEHGAVVWAVHYHAHAEIWVTWVALPHNKSSGEGAGRLAEVTDSKAGLLQVHLLCSGSGATSVWQWCDTKSLPVREAAGRPPIKTRRLGETFHRPQLSGCDSMPTHYSWRVVCLACVISKGVSLQELCVNVCGYLSYKLAFLIPVIIWLILKLHFTPALNKNVPFLSAPAKVWKNGHVPVSWLRQDNERSKKVTWLPTAKDLCKMTLFKV